MWQAGLFLCCLELEVELLRVLLIPCRGARAWVYPENPKVRAFACDLWALVGLVAMHMFLCAHCSYCINRVVASKAKVLEHCAHNLLAIRGFLIHFLHRVSNLNVPLALYFRVACYDVNGIWRKVARGINVRCACKVDDIILQWICLEFFA